MLSFRRVVAAAVFACAAAGFSATTQAASCGNGAAGFPAWLQDFKQEAARAGISPRVIDAALSGVSYQSKVIRLDRGQHSFKLSFDEFYRKRVNDAMIRKGRQLIDRYASTLSSIEKRTGVPPEVIVSIWGLETGYGRNSGSMATFPSLATLAYDCRRSAFFTGELLAALKIVERGDLTPAQMRGAWAGELGQTQFLASSYLRFAVDGDGNGRRDLINSVPDVLASTANYLRAYGWQAGQSWEPGTANYNVLHQWNKADVYVKTISVMASKMAGRG
ncbi:lytic murein transglycosylase [Rhodopseudomonas julia]|uniref:Lytic murein transglycosylase n=1 Tax=Rhodopseudomonas julia TaxID=200617 RepID=A0ABU0C5Z6_9BRAD|nr:lytic murein transglycosylase [Rhodopseudomonas julia]MDQ0325946.1 lytic murein transglycosylase [Rhodopseudomonas julia]